MEETYLYQLTELVLPREVLGYFSIVKIDQGSTLFRIHLDEKMEKELSRERYTGLTSLRMGTRRKNCSPEANTFCLSHLRSGQTVKSKDLKSSLRNILNLKPLIAYAIR